jgi:glycosyltransferase involved in cell wall biosynthesis
VKIALIMQELLVEGGGERQCFCLASELAAQGHQVTIYASSYDRQNCFPQLCTDLNVKETGRGRFAWLQRPRFIRGYLDMVRLAKVIEEKHDVWNPHHWPGQWGAVWLKEKLGGAVVWMSNDVPNLHEKAQQQHPVRNFLKAVVYRLYYLYDRAQNRKVDITVLVSKWAEDEFRRIYPGKTCVVHPGMDPSQFQPGGDREKIRTRFGYAPDDFVVLWLGIIMPHRRLQDAIDALADLRKRGLKVKLLIAGSEDAFPEYVNSLKAQVAGLGLERDVTFSGKVVDNEIRDFYCAAHAFVFPNEHQTWGLAVLEAMSCGCPVVVSRGAAVHEALLHNENAVLFPGRTPVVLADQIERLATDRPFRLKIAEHGMQLVRSRYGWKQYAENVLGLFGQFVSEGAKESKLPQELTAAEP